MLMLTVGLVMFSHQGDLLGSPGWLLLGLASAMVLFFMHSYPAFFGGCILAIYTMSLWPHIVKGLTAFPVGKTLSFAVLTFIVLFLLSAWVVAYNFVPGGTITRERTDVLLVITVCLIGLASRNVEPSGTQPEAKSGESKRKKSEHTPSSKSVRRLSTISEERSETEEVEESVHKARSREMFLVEEKEYHHFHEKIVQGQLDCGVLTLRERRWGGEVSEQQLAGKLWPNFLFYSCHTHLPAGCSGNRLPLPTPTSNAREGS